MSSSSILRTCLLFVIVLLIPIVPFVLMGDWFEPWVEEALQGTWLKQNLLAGSLVFIAALSSDILLPIPSSVVCTLAGHIFGPWAGTLVSWLGLSFSCGIGYALGKYLGLPVVRRLSDEQYVNEMTEFVRRRGVWALVVCRAIPVVAEATVLVAGVYELDRRKFWLAVILSNLGIAIAYAILGDVAAENGWLSIGLAVALALPVAFLVPWWIRIRGNAENS